MDDPSGFARRLDVALRARGVGKMMALAVALDVDESALSRWRRGKPISIGNLIRLCRHLRVSIDWLLTGVGSMDAEGADADGAWKSEIFADFQALEPPMRRNLAELMRHLAGRVQHALQFDIQRVGADPAAVHGAQHLHVPHGGAAEGTRDALPHDGDDLGGGGREVRRVHDVEVGPPGSGRR